ncbi:MAG: hypothetical protein M0Z54_12515 [Thermaerobacter sp.]|nr:hypothetical protein [Thermaerobacter sp.]
MTVSLTVDLARRLEWGMAAANPRVLTALHQVAPSHPGALLTRQGVTAVYGGPGFPLNQAVGVGMEGPVSPDLAGAIEVFYGTHHASVVRVASLAHPTAFSVTADRGYHHQSGPPVGAELDPLAARRGAARPPGAGG